MTIALTNLNRDRYLAARNAAGGEDVGLLLIRSMATATLSLSRQGYGLDTAVGMAVAATYGWDIEDDTDIQRDIEDEVASFLARNT